MGKGSRRETEFADLMARAGWAPYRPATVRFGENDVWGLFDVLAIEPTEGLLAAVQVKSNRATGLTAWSRQTWPWRRAEVGTFYAVPIDNQGWRLIHVDAPGEWNDVVDERSDERIGTNQHTPLSPGDGVVQWLRGEA